VPRPKTPRKIWLTLVLSLLPGCTAIRPLPAATPELPLQPWENVAVGGEAGAAKSERAQSSATLAKATPAAPRPGPRPVLPARSAGDGPGGAECLAELAVRGVRFSKAESVLGVATPVEVSGPIGGVQFYSHEKKPLLLDCRLALALYELGSDFRALGVTRVRYSGAYVYRTSHPGRMSMHAYGLAIDLHAFEIDGHKLEVKHSFQRGQGTRCGAGSAALNRLACRIRQRGLFKEQIGPDDNAAHRDHFHLGLKPLPGELAADLPWPKAAPKAPRRKRSSR
jgi:hypothetical protein